MQKLVQAAVDEIYGGIWAPVPLQIDVEDWTRGWVADNAGDVVGVILTHQD